MATKIRSTDYNFRSKPRYKDDTRELKKKAIVYGTVSVIILGLLLYYGPTLISGIGSAGQRINKSDDPITTSKSELDVELPPQLETLPTYSNKDTIELKGNAVAGHVIEVVVNDEKIGETVVGSDNQFNYLNIRLKEGDNTIVATSKNQDGSKSASATTSIIYDRKPPKLELNDPNTDLSVAKETTQVTISGTTDTDALVSINDIQTVVNGDGSFHKVVGIKDGPNPIKVDAQDLAGNHKKLEFTITR
jgi:hypothetical protein